MRSNLSMESVPLGGTGATVCLEGTQELRRRWHDTPAQAELARIARRDTAVQVET